MKKIVLPYISVRQLLKRWDVQVSDIEVAFRHGLRFPRYKNKEYSDFLRFFSIPEDYSGRVYDGYLDNVMFKAEDIMSFEDKHNTQGETKKNNLSAEDFRELGRLRHEKSKWYDSISAAVKIGIFCNQIAADGDKITKGTLTDEIYNMGFKDLPKTTIEKIWKAIPEQYRKKSGRPSKKKK